MKGSARVRIFVALSMSFVGFLLGLLFALTPAKQIAFEYTWTPNQAEDAGVLALDRSWPQKLNLAANIGCQEGVSRNIFSSGGLTVSCNNEGELIITSGDMKLGFAKTFERTLLSLAFDAEDSRLQVTFGSEARSVKLLKAQYPKIEYLSSNSPAQDALEITFTSRAAIQEFPQFRWLYAGLGCVAALVSLAVFPFGGSSLATKGTTRGRRSIINWRNIAPDLFVAVAVYTNSLMIPNIYDEGWVLQRLRQFADTGTFGDFYQHENAWLPQGFIHELVFASFMGNQGDFLTLRLIVATSTFATWLTIRYLIMATISKIKDYDNLTAWIAASFYIAGSSAWLTTIRAEPIVVFLVALELASVLHFAKSRGRWPLLAAVVFGVLAIQTHQTGLIALPGLIYIAGAIFKDREDGIAKVWLRLFTSSALGVIVLFVGYDLNTLLENASDFRSGSSNIFSEVGRWTNFLSESNSSSTKKFVILVGFLFWVLGFAIVHAEKSKSRTLLAISLMSPVCLVLTSSKWLWHLAVLVLPFTIILWIWLRHEEKFRGRLQNHRVYVLPASGLLAAIALASGGGWGSYDSTPEYAWADFTAKVAGPESQIYWATFIISLGVLAFYLQKSPHHMTRLLSVTLAAVLLVPTALSLYWISRTLRSDQPQPNWSSITMAGQNLEKLTHPSSESCGILGNERIYLSDISKLDEVGNSATLPNNFSIESGKVMQPPFKGLGIWSTDLSVPKSGVGPVFKVKDKSQVAFWWSGGFEANPGIVLIFRDGQGREVASYNPSLNQDIAGTWRLQTKTVPDSATTAQLIVHNPNQWVSVSNIVEPIYDKAQNLLGQKGTETWVPPWMLPRVPCALLPTSNFGRLSDLRYLVDQGSWSTDSFLFFRQVTLTEIGQAGSGLPGIWLVTLDSPSHLSVKEITTN